MEEVIAWITAEGRLPRGHSENRGERSMARWLAERRREAAEGTLDPAYRNGLARVQEMDRNPQGSCGRDQVASPSGHYGNPSTEPLPGRPRTGIGIRLSDESSSEILALHQEGRRFRVEIRHSQLGVSTLGVTTETGMNMHWDGTGWDPPRR